MGDPLIGYANWADLTIFSNGSWRPNLPLSNLGEPTLGRLARSTSASLNSTKFDANIGIGRLARIIALLNHNMRTGAQFRLRGDNDVNFSSPIVDTGWQQVWPVVYSSDQLEWEADNFWLGTYTQDEINGYPWHLIILLDSPILVPYWRLEIDDQANPDGYVQAGRLFIGDAWKPSVGIAFNASLGWEDPSTITASLSGSKFSDGKKPYRVARILTHFMETDEAYSKAFEIQRRSGTWKEVLYIHDEDDTLHSIRRRFPGRLRVLGPLENPYPDAHQATWEIEESLP